MRREDLRSGDGGPGHPPEPGGLLEVGLMFVALGLVVATVSILAVRLATASVLEGVTVGMGMVATFLIGIHTGSRGR